jgi:chitinase
LPGQEPNLDRGGRKEDGDNLVLLVKEMREAFDAHPFRFGLSVVLAPDISYLMNFKPRKMQQYVDFFGFMAYDLGKPNGFKRRLLAVALYLLTKHAAGPWDQGVKALGARVRPHTDLSIIERISCHYGPMAWIQRK